jgi:hypothetical protein
MKKRILTLVAIGFATFASAQVASEFGAEDILICDFESKNLVVVDSLWSDTTKTTAITAQSQNIQITDNPFPIENESEKAAKYVRPAGAYKSVFIRFNESVVFAKTPYLQVQVYPVLGKSPAKSTVSINLLNDKGEIVSGSGSMSNLPQDEWTTVTAFFGRLKSSAKYNTIEIMINADDSISKLGGTEYYIDQIGFKAPEGGGVLPSTIFYENFGGYNDDWQNGRIKGQYTVPNADGTGVYGPGEYGLAEAYISTKGFSSGLPFTFRDVQGDSATALHIRTWSMNAVYEGASYGGRIEFANYRPGTLETGDIDVSDNSDFMLSFGIGTQLWWPYNGEIANVRPKVEIAVDGGSFYEIFSESEFLKFTGEQDDLGWGLMDKYEDQVFKLVEYPFTTVEGAPITGDIKTINIRMSYKAGTSFWVDDLWLSAKPVVKVGVNNALTDKNLINIYPNPATDFINIKGAQNVSITDLSGRVVITSVNSDEIDISSLSKGAYLVKAYVDKNKIISGRFVKK